VGRKGGKSPKTYFAGAASHSSQMPLLLNLVTEEEGEEAVISISLWYIRKRLVKLE